MYKRLLRSVLAAAFSAVVAYGVLAGGTAAPQPTVLDSGWGSAPVDSGWGSTVVADTPDSGWGSAPADTGA
jgi:hypothetical protein